MIRLLALLSLLSSSLAFAAAEPARPKLVMMVVIDQFRADYLMRFSSRFLPAKGEGGAVGGFKYLMEQGAYFPYGQYDILQSMTGPGHATVLSGSYPYLMGIPANDWYDSGKKARMYCTEDGSEATVGAKPRSTHVGTSPRNFLGTTVGDELKNAGYPSRVVSLALKDRAAILMGGHRADIAVWFDQTDFQWVSSKYYLPDGKLPGWLAKLNEKMTSLKGKELTWKLDEDASATGFSAPDAMMLKNDWNNRIGPSFPHATQFGKPGTLNIPFALDMTNELAERAIDHYKLGSGKGTDLLAVSFSAHDYLSHAFGPNSRELEEMTVADDRAIARLLNKVRTSVPGGLKNVVIAFTADHGAPSNPDWLKAEGKIDAGRIDEEAVGKKLIEFLNSKYGKPSEGEWVSFVVDLNFYLNHAAMAAKKLDPSVVETEAKTWLLKNIEGAAYAFTATDYREHRLPPGMHERQILHTYFPGRSGDVFVLPKPFWMSGNDTVTHMTGYAYDRTVPIILLGAPFKPGRYATRAEVIDIAPTLTFLSGTMPPSLTEGRVLSEALQGK